MFTAPDTHTTLHVHSTRYTHNLACSQHQIHTQPCMFTAPDTHKTLHVHSTRYTQCMHVSSHKLYWPWLLVPALWHCGRSWSRPYWRLHVGPALLSSPCSTLAVQTHQLLLFHGLFELCPFAVKRKKQIKSKGRQHFFKSKTTKKQNSYKNKLLQQQNSNKN